MTSRMDELLSLEGVYFSAPIPRNTAVLTLMGVIFDKVYFPFHLHDHGHDLGLGTP
jgi:hypothetical protein